MLCGLGKPQQLLLVLGAKVRFVHPDLQAAVLLWQKLLVKSNFQFIVENLISQLLHGFDGGVLHGKLYGRGAIRKSEFFIFSKLCTFWEVLLQDRTKHIFPNSVQKPPNLMRSISGSNMFREKDFLRFKTFDLAPHCPLHFDFGGFCGFLFCEHRIREQGASAPLVAIPCQNQFAWFEFLLQINDDIITLVFPAVSWVLISHLVQIRNFAFLAASATHSIPQVQTGQIIPSHFSHSHLAGEEDYFESLPKGYCFMHFRFPHFKPTAAPRSCLPTSLPGFLSLSFGLEHLLWIGILTHHNCVCALSFLPRSLLLFTITSCWKHVQVPKFLESALPVNSRAIASHPCSWWGFRVSGMLPEAILWRAKEDACYALFIAFVDESIPPRSKLPRERYHALGGLGSDFSFVTAITCILQDSWHVLECKTQTWKIICRRRSHCFLIFLPFSLPERDRLAEQTKIWKHVTYRIRYSSIWCDMRGHALNERSQTPFERNLNGWAATNGLERKIHCGWKFQLRVWNKYLFPGSVIISKDTPYQVVIREPYVLIFDDDSWICRGT